MLLSTIGISIFAFLDKAKQQEQHLLLEQIVTTQAATIERRLSSLLSSTYMLAQEVRQSEGRFQNFEQYADDVINTLGDISLLQLAPNGIIERVHPLKGNEKSLGHNLLEDKARSKEALLTMKANKLTLAGPFKLVQGGVGIVGRNPVFLEKDGKDYFWGFTIALIFLSDLLDGTELTQLYNRGYEYELSRIHPDTGKRDIFSHSKNKLGENAVFKSINIPNGVWRMGISRHSTDSAYIYLGVGASFIVALLFSLLLHRILLEPERLRTQIKEKTEALNQMAFHDELTGLVNRRFLGDKLEQEIRNLRRRGEGHIAIMYLDLDDFKRINDTMGHEMGDRLLQTVAARLRDTVRQNDIIARLGGDEFAVILLDLASPDHARVMAEKIIENIQRPIQLGPRKIVISTTIGITLTPDDSTEILELFRNADLAMFASKQAGKNRLSFFNTQMQENAAKHLLLEEQLRQAIDNKEFYLVYQPIMCLGSNQVGKFEALIRWRHPEAGERSPNEFIGMAETTGLIIPIGYWVIHEACMSIVNQLNGPKEKIQITINVSTRQLKDENFAIEVEKIFKKTGVDPSLIEMEITESMLMEDVNLALKLINQLKKIGVAISIDDFGTGYSSLSQLKKFPIDTLKVDRAFIKDLGKDMSDRRIVEAIVAMANKLNIAVVAEGIETERQLRFLRKINCDYGQGFLFSKPLSINNALLFDTNNSKSSQELRTKP